MAADNYRAQETLIGCDQRQSYAANIWAALQLHAAIEESSDKNRYVATNVDDHTSQST